MIDNYNEALIKPFTEYFRDKGLNDNAICGMLGNLYSESKLYANNLQNTFNKSLGMTDEEYTLAVDEGLYTSFTHDGAGYGLCQWTQKQEGAGRKQELYDLAQEQQVSIGYARMQFDMIWWELTTKKRFKNVFAELTNPNNTVASCAEIFLCEFEVPGSVLNPDTRQATIDKRVGFAHEFYNKYFAQTYTNSPLACMTLISPNRNSPRNHIIDTITIHCFVGQVSVERGCEVFQPESKQASCNYVIGTDGRIGLVVEECDRSWCSSSPENDNRAITIECASDNFAPYAINDAVMMSLIELCADICKRNNIKELKFSFDKNERMNHLNGVNMTCHRDYAKKSCPGDYIYNLEPYIADEVNKILNGETPEPFEPYKVRVSLVIREGAGAEYPIVGYIPVGVYTIVAEENGWGKLKSGIGWIPLDSVIRL